MNFLFKHSTQRFSLNDFIFRLKKLQKIVDKEEVDCLLVLNGVDSNHSFESTKLINWLFLGFNGIEIEQNEYMDEIFNELILVIKKKGQISIYCEPPLFETLKGFLIAIPNLEIYCPTDKQYENKDDMELIKITQFIKMVRDIKVIGILLEAKFEGNVNNIEKWPLIQAYGQADLGFGFFTMDKKIVSLTKRINTVYKNHDKFSLEKLFYNVASRLSNHIKNAFVQINSSKFNKRVAITEDELCDILKDSYEFGELGKFVRQGDSKELPKPRILFGVNTAKSFEFGSGVDTFLSASHQKPKYALHATVEYVDIVSKLRVGRTYFLRKNVRKEINVENILDEMDDLASYKLGYSGNDSFQEEEILINCYLALIISCYENFHGFSQNYKLLSKEFIEQNILKTVGKVYSAFHENQFLESKNIIVSLKCYNSFGEEVKIDFKDSISFKLTPYIYMLRAQVNGIKNPLDGNDLGSLLFCESFLIQEGCFLLLTKETTYFNLWNIHSELTDKIQNMRITIIANELGKCLTKDVVCDNNRVFFPHEKLINYNIELPIIPSKLILYEKGLKIFNEQFGWMIILFNMTAEFNMIQKLEKPWVIIKLNENLIGQSLKCNKICIELSGNAFTAIFFKLKEIIQANGVKYEELNDIPPFFFSSNAIKLESKILPSNYTLPTVNMNKSQILNPKLLLSYLESKQLVILNKLSDLKLANYKPLYEDFLMGPAQELVISSSQIPILIINGSHCSGKTRFAESLLRYESDFSCKMNLLAFKRYEMPKLDENAVIRRVIDFAVERKIVAKDNLVILVQPAKLNTATLIDLITKNPDVSSKFRIKAVVTKMNINNMFENINKQFVRKGLGFAVEGYSQFLILDSYGISETQIDQWNKLIKMALPSSNLYRIMNNIVPMSIVQDIMKFDSFESEKNRFERLKNAVYCEFVERPIPNSELFIPFHIPIVKDKMQNHLFKEIMRKNDGFLYKKREISKEERERAEKSKDLLAMELLKLREMMMDLDSRMSHKTPHIVFIKGIARFYKGLEEGLYEVTINSNYCIERVMKTVKTKVVKEKISETLEIEKAYYENFDDLKMIGFLFYGENLVEEKLTQLLKEISQIQEIQRIKLMRKGDVTEEMKKKIQFEKRGVGLEDGEFFDGSCFRDNCGRIFDCHPKLEQFVEEFLEERNKEIIKKNEEMEREIKKAENSLKLF